MGLTLEGQEDSGGREGLIGGGQRRCCQGQQGLQPPQVVPLHGPSVSTQRRGENPGAWHRRKRSIILKVSNQLVNITYRSCKESLGLLRMESLMKDPNVCDVLGSGFIVGYGFNDTHDQMYSHSHSNVSKEKTAAGGNIVGISHAL